LRAFLFFVIVFPGLLIQSCISTYFESPQPYGQKSEYVFPEQLRGRYLLSFGNDSIDLQIGDSLIRMTMISHSAAALSDTAKTDSLLKVYENWNNKTRSRYEGSFREPPRQWERNDTLHISKSEGTIYALGGKTSLRRLNDSVFFFNRPHDTKPWWSAEVFYLTHDGKLCLQFPIHDLRTAILLEAQYRTQNRTVSPQFEDTLRLYEKIAPRRPGTSKETNLINPTPAQLKQLYEAKFFRTVAIFERKK